MHIIHNNNNKQYNNISKLYFQCKIFIEKHDDDQKDCGNNLRFKSWALKK
jgi:hypothetical protein